jgi:hypothetical protein
MHLLCASDFISAEKRAILISVQNEIRTPMAALCAFAPTPIATQTLSNVDLYCGR